MGKRERVATNRLRQVWLEALELSDREQYQLYEWLRDLLRLGVGEPVEPDPVIDGRKQALDDMRKAATHAGLAAGKAPTVAQYDQARKELGLALSSQQIVRRWGYWRTAKRVLEGASVPRTAKQREHLRMTVRKRQAPEDYVEGIRTWLATGPLLLEEKSYNDYVKAHNANREDDGLPLVQWQAINTALGLTWREALRVAQGDIELDEAREQADRRRLEERGRHGLIGLGDIAVILDRHKSVAARDSRRPGFPAHVATFGGARAWYASDIEAFRDGKPYPERAKDEMQDKFLTSDDISRITGLAINGISEALREEHWNRFPPSAGRVSGKHYWDKAEVEQWQRERQAAGDRTAGPGGSASVKRRPGRPKKAKNLR